MPDQTLEPFPPVIPIPEGSAPRTNAPRPRRKSSNLGGEPRGDTGVTALATLKLSSAPDSILNVSPNPSLLAHVSIFAMADT